MEHTGRYYRYRNNHNLLRETNKYNPTCPSSSVINQGTRKFD
ncbi:hypothetical protein CCACVL1_08052 [Corchorus capsularis]|uniref:Uncharacterized protein n=1 Tax=Corchorus capsularis TaxID=210143 RepID=A0A1R3J2I8_COCAP|nr:hypothetical protein CCACVL1_08052 [Corchorus capsularis]